MKFVSKKMTASLLALAMLLGLSACGSSTETEETATEATATETATTAITETSEDVSAIMDEVAERLADYSGQPVFYPEDFGDVDAKGIIEGKRVFLIPYDATNPFCTNIAEYEKLVLEYLGAEVFIYNGDGTADSWSTGIQTAVNQGYDVIDIIGGASVDQLESQIQEAQAAGIYVQDTHNTDIHEVFPVDTQVEADLTHNAELIALETIRQAGDPSELNVLIVADIGITADNYMKAGLTSVFDEYDVKYTIKEVAITNWTNGISEQVRTAFTADQTINAVVAYYDYMMLYAIPTLEELGIANEDVIVGSYNGSPALLDYISAGSMDFDIGESVPWTAFHSVDSMARSLAGQEHYGLEGFASFVINQDNIADFLDPETGKGSYQYDGVSGVYLPGYTELWGYDVTGIFAE